MYPHLTITHEKDRKTILTGYYRVKVCLGPDEAPIVLSHYGMGHPTVEFKLDHDLVEALREGIEKLAARAAVA